MRFQLRDVLIVGIVFCSMLAAFAPMIRSSFENPSQKSWRGSSHTLLNSFRDTSVADVGVAIARNAIFVIVAVLLVRVNSRKEVSNKFELRSIFAITTAMAMILALLRSNQFDEPLKRLAIVISVQLMILVCAAVVSRLGSSDRDTFLRTFIGLFVGVAMAAFALFLSLIHI